MSDTQELIQRDFDNGGGELARDVEDNEMMEVVSIADLMKPQETPATQEAPAPETAQQATQEQPQIETPAITETPAIETELPKVEYAPAPQPEFNLLDEVQKFGDKKALLKTLGLDDYLLGAVEHYQQTGDMTPYLEVKSVDYTKLPENSIVEKKLREQYSQHGLSEEDLKMLVEDEMLTRYKQDDTMYSEREVQLGKIKMKADAAEYRNQFIERQQKFAPPPPPQRQPEAVQPTTEEIVNANKQRLLAEPVVSQFTKNPVITIGKDDLSFKYESKNSNALLSAIVDPNQTAYYTSKKNEYGQIVTDINGNPVPDYEFLLELAAHMTDRANYNSLLMKHGKSLGTKAVSEQINPVAPVGEQHVPPPQEVDELTALASALKGMGY